MTQHLTRQLALPHAARHSQAASSASAQRRTCPVHHHALVLLGQRTTSSQHRQRSQPRRRPRAHGRAARRSHRQAHCPVAYPGLGTRYAVPGRPRLALAGRGAIFRRGCHRHMCNRPGAVGLPAQEGARWLIDIIHELHYLQVGVALGNRSLFKGCGASSKKQSFLG